MKRTIAIGMTVAGMLILLPGQAHALPPLTGHDHNESTIQWESDGVEDGNSAHNHRSNRSFGGDQMRTEPYSIDHCWDDNTYRLDETGTFDSGHCHIEESDEARVVRYRFIGGQVDGAGNRIWVDLATGVDAGLKGFHARKRITEVFERYNEVLSTTGNLVTAIEFREVTSGDAEIEIYWEDQGGVNNGGFWSDSARELRFDNSMSWYFGVDPKVGDPFGIREGNWHFFSVALHEVGHAVGFEHQNDADDVMTPPVGAPPDSANPRYFTGLDPDTLTGVRDVYSQPNAAPVTQPSLNSIVAYFFWTDVFNATSYELERSADETGPFQPLHVEPAPTPGVVLTQFAFAPPYFVRVRACNTAGCGPFSEPREYND